MGKHHTDRSRGGAEIDRFFWQRLVDEETLLRLNNGGTAPAEEQPPQRQPPNK